MPRLVPSFHARWFSLPAAGIPDHLHWIHWLLAFAILAMLASLAAGECPPIDFEDYAINTAITTQYPGITFSVQALPTDCGAG